MYLHCEDLLVTKMDIPDVDLTDVPDDDLAQRCGSSGPVDLFNWGLYSGDLHNRSNGIVSRALKDSFPQSDKKGFR